jgi:hypothetical protein
MPEDASGGNCVHATSNAVSRSITLKSAQIQCGIDEKLTLEEASGVE